MHIRSLCDSDYEKVIPVVDAWWGGRQMAHLLPRLFFEHFNTTSFVIEKDEMLVAFLIGFQSQTHVNEAYIHFIGVHPDYRKHGFARELYNRFFQNVREKGCDTVRCITSPVNEGSVRFHTHMGFSSSLATDYAGPGQNRILFVRHLPL